MSFDRSIFQLCFDFKSNNVQGQGHEIEAVKVGTPSKILISAFLIKWKRNKKKSASYESLLIWVLFVVCFYLCFIIVPYFDVLIEYENCLPLSVLFTVLVSFFFSFYFFVKIFQFYFWAVWQNCNMYIKSTSANHWRVKQINY